MCAKFDTPSGTAPSVFISLWGDESDWPLQDQLSVVRAYVIYAQLSTLDTLESCVRTRAIPLLHLAQISLEREGKSAVHPEILLVRASTGSVLLLTCYSTKT